MPLGAIELSLEEVVLTEEWPPANNRVFQEVGSPG